MTGKKAILPDALSFTNPYNINPTTSQDARKMLMDKDKCTDPPLLTCGADFPSPPFFERP
jgi:hypothetical protein